MKNRLGGPGGKGKPLVGFFLPKVQKRKKHRIARYKGMRITKLSAIKSIAPAYSACPA